MPPFGTVSVLLSLPVWFALASASTSASATVASHKKTVELAVSEIATFDVDSYSLHVEFAKVERDSRCPVDVKCVRAGEAIVVLRAHFGEDDAKALRFEVPPGGGDEQTLDGVVLKIEELRPEAHSEHRIHPDEYVVTVTADRVP